MLEEKYLSLSKSKKLIIIVATLVLSLIAFGGCAAIKLTIDSIALEIALCSVGMFAFVLTTMFGIYLLIEKTQPKENQ